MVQADGGKAEFARDHAIVPCSDDAEGQLRLVMTMPSWEDYLSLALDEIRVFGMTSVQVMRRMRWCLRALAAELGEDPRAVAVERYLDHLDRAIVRSPLDEDDQGAASAEDAQGLGLSRSQRSHDAGG